MKQTLQSLLAIGLILGIGFPLWKFVIAVEEPPQKAPPRDLGPVPVEVRTLRPQEIVLVVDAFGNLEPRRSVRLAAEVSGRIVAVHGGWRPGAMVEEGELLMALDRTLFELDVREAAALVDEREAGVDTAELELRQAQGVHEKSIEQRAIAVREHERTIELAGVVSESLRDQAHAARLDAELAEETARVNLAGSRAALRAAGARAESARVILARAEKNLLRTEIRAPFRGRLRGQAPGLGTLAGASEPLGELIDPFSLVLSVRVPERDLLLLERGMPAVIGFPSTPETRDELEFTGHVAAVDAASDPLTRRGLVEVELDDRRLPDTAPRSLGEGDLDGRKLRPAVLLPAGLFAQARIEVARIAGALWIDRRHFTWIDGAPIAYVLAVDPDDPERSTAERRVLVLAREHGEGFLLGGGLAPGERLITHPLDRLGAGTEVRVLERSAGGK